MILWGAEHEDRARALSAVTGDIALGTDNLLKLEGIYCPLISTDETLTFWGHGSAESFCEMKDVEFGVFLKKWKKVNPSLKNVELITCDAQHNIQPLMGFAMRAAKFVQEDYKDVVFKALPVGQNPDDRSILWASVDPPTFCYITAPSEETFTYANNRLQQLAREKFANDLGLVAAEMAKERTLEPPRDYTVIGSCLGVLRDTLGVVKAG